MIPLRTLNIYRDKIDKFINKGYCHARIWPVYDAWIEGKMGLSYDCITDGKTIYAIGYNGLPQIKIGDTINRKKYIYDYTHHFYEGIDLNISFKIGGLKRRVLYNICHDNRITEKDMCCSKEYVDTWGDKSYSPNISLCYKRHKNDYCSGFAISIHGETFYKSDLLTKRACNVPYWKNLDDLFSIMDKYPQIVRPQ
jgi:hypothetical protein